MDGQVRQGDMERDTRNLIINTRIYINTPHEHIVTNVVSGRKMRVQK